MATEPMILLVYDRVKKATTISNYRKVMYRCKICNSELLETSIKEHTRTHRHREVIDPFPEARYLDYTDEHGEHYKQIQDVLFKLLGFRDVTSDDPNPLTNVNNIYKCMRCEDLVVGSLATLHSHCSMPRCVRGTFKNFIHLPLVNYKAV